MTVRVGIIGSGFVANLHAEAFRYVPDAEVVAAASPDESHVRDFARRHDIPHAHTDYRQLLERDDIDVVTIACPNYLHCQVTLDAAAAGKHVVCEKPLAMNVEECDRMIEACRKASVKLMYAEELCFAPKYVRAKELADEGALGNVYYVRQLECHYGPHADWFWDVEKSGGGVLMDMGCHSIQFARWVYGNAPVESVYAELGTFVHGERTRGEDHSLCVLRFDGNRVAVAENSWARTGGVDDRAEIYGSKGLTVADLLRGSSLVTFSEPGYGYAVEKAPQTRGWTFTMFQETWNYGFPQEMQHFAECVRDDKEPRLTGDDGRAVLEIICAAYESAGTGQRVKLPFRPEVKKPVDLWLRG
ncbi:MAG: Gfo/Idh/MocA family oxidoreductase [Chloroflexi bacterium]|nr:Gfo/Idh/MocA family oxidoreductase [Chloroflexota bacterium]